MARVGVSQLVLAFVLLSPLAALAQDASKPVTVRIQVSGESEGITGVLVGAFDSLLTLREGSTFHSIRFADIRSVEISEHTRSNAKKYAWWGFAGGAAVGAFVGGVLTQQGFLLGCDSQPDGCPGEAAVTTAAAIGIFGAGLGALVGATSREPVWTPYRLEWLQSGSRISARPVLVLSAAAIHFEVRLRVPHL